MAYIGKLRTEVSEDLTPQLGGDLDLNGNSIEGVSAAEMGYLDGVTSDIQTQLGGKVDDSQVLTNVPVNALFTDTDTTTTLSVAANILTYTDEDGLATNIDLSLYLDDTNAAYITAGSLDGTSGVATFTRSDATSFDVNMSAFLDDTKLTDAEIGAMGYIKIDTNTQVTVNNTLTSTSTTEALSAKQGKVLQDNKVANTRVLTDVPSGALFTDTDTTYSAGSGMVLSGTEFSVGELSEGKTINNINNINTNTTTVINSDRNHILIGDITVSGSATWNITGTGELHIITF